MVTWSRIVCAVDFSETSRRALQHAAELARRFHADLEIVHVWKGPRGGAGEEKLTAAEKSELGRDLEEWEREAEQIAGREVGTVLTIGSPATEVARIASDGKADLIVAGSRGRTGFERAVLGSVAEEILRRSPCAVLVVKAERGRGD
jgi:nucleotide-binding universal stress UspA family protein